MAICSISVLGKHITNLTSRTEAAAEVKALAANRGFSVITAVIEACANPYYIVSFPDGESIFVDYNGDDDIYFRTQKLLPSRIQSIKDRINLLGAHVNIVDGIIDPDCDLDCFNCPAAIRGRCEKVDSANSKIRMLDIEIGELYRMKKILRDRRRP